MRDAVALPSEPVARETVRKREEGFIFKELEKVASCEAIGVQGLFREERLREQWWRRVSGVVGEVMRGQTSAIWLGGSGFLDMYHQAIAGAEQKHDNGN